MFLEILKTILIVAGKTFCLWWLLIIILKPVIKDETRVYNIVIATIILMLISSFLIIMPGVETEGRKFLMNVRSSTFFIVYTILLWFECRKDWHDARLSDKERKDTKKAAKIMLDISIICSAISIGVAIAKAFQYKLI